MNGKTLVIIILAIAITAGAGLWYSIERAYYTKVTGIADVEFGAEMIAVSDYHGIDAETSPLKLRACFQTDQDFSGETHQNDTATPLRAPRFFKCFDAGQITEDLKSDAAKAVIAVENKPFGFDTYIAAYPDGHAFMWRQINSCGEARFEGRDLPEECSDLGKAKTEDTTEAVIEPRDKAPDFIPATADLRLTPFTGTPPETILYEGLQAVTVANDPMQFHGCFKTDMSFGLLTETYQVHETPRPQAQNLPCFQADQLQRDLDRGVALAFVGEKNIHPGLERVVAVYDDGRGYVWHQINPCSEAQYSGQDLPEKCEAYADTDALGQLKMPGVAVGGVPIEVEITLVQNGNRVEKRIVTRELIAISDNSDPHSFFACFMTEGSISFLVDAFESAKGAAPSAPAASLPCFNADKIASDLTNGTAFAFVSTRDVWPGIDRFVVIYDDGRGYAWHQRMQDE